MLTDFDEKIKICEVISLRRVFDTTKVRQDYADNAGEMKFK